MKDAILAWPDRRGEPDIESYIDYIIKLGEARINRDLRIRDMLLLLENLNGPYSTDPIPTDFLQLDRITGPDGRSLEFRPADEIARLGVEQRNPIYYSIDGRIFRFSPAVESYTINYYARMVPLLSQDNPIYENEPGLWLYSCLIDAAVFAKEDEAEVQRYSSSYSQIVDGIHAKDIESRYPRSQSARSFIDIGRNPGPSQ